MLLALTGAGISRASGIPTFMERPDIRERLSRDFARTYPQEYRQTIRDLYELIVMKEPNDAHKALFDYGIEVMTMNIDGLHEKAGSLPLQLHGTLPDENELDIAESLSDKPVLYGDNAPLYREALRKVNTMNEGDILLVVGASHYTQIAVSLRELAYIRGAEIIEIQEAAELKLRECLETLKEQGRL